MRTLEPPNRMRIGLMGIVVTVLVIGVGQSFTSVPILFAKPSYYGQFTDSGGINTGDKVRIDLNKGSANILIPDAEIKKRHADLKAKGGFPYPANQTPWQELYRSTVGQQSTGACMELATRYHDIAGKIGVARDNH